MSKVILLFFFIQQCLFSQILSKKSLIKDLNFLNEAAINGHPINFNSENITNINEVINKANQISNDSLSCFDYSLWIEKALFYIGCVHTSVQKNPLQLNQQKQFHIPLTALIRNDKLFITSCSDNLLQGNLVETINGCNVLDIINTYKEYKASDGVTDAFSKAYFLFNSSKLISNYFNNPNKYHLQTSTSTFELQAISKDYELKNNEEKINTIYTNGINNFYIKDNVAVLKISKFYKNDKKFLKKSFRLIENLKCYNLILDLRFNTGGNRKSAIELTKYLVDTTFGYSILQPKLKLKKYLNPKGKWYLFLSKLKYNIGAVLKGRKTLLGKEFKFVYDPKKTNNYKGKIFVITDGFTASASTMVTSWLKQFSDAIFIGSQASGGYNGNNGGSFPLITLP